jgi:hypothetical protein
MNSARQSKGFKSPIARLCRIALSFALLAGSAVACSSSESTAPAGRPSGNWTGSLTSGTFGISLNLVMVEDAAGKVTGNGFITSAVSGVTNATSAVTLTGTFVSPHLSANLASQGFNTMNLSGAIAGDNFNAQLNGSGFSNETMVLKRQ